MKYMYETEYKGVAIRVTYDIDDHGSCVAWRVFLDDEEVHYTTTEVGVFLLGVSHEYTEEWCDLDEVQGNDALRDPAQVLIDSKGDISVVPVSEGRGRTLWVSGDPDWNVESLPLQLVRPYIDHILALRLLYQRTIFERELDIVLKGAEVPN